MVTFPARTEPPPQAAPVDPAGKRADFGSTLALTMTLAIACFALVAPLVILAVEPTLIPGGVPGEDTQRQRAETGLYLAAFFVILPLALIAGPRLADAIAAGPNCRALGWLSALLPATLALAVVLARLSDLLWNVGSGVVLGPVGAWTAAAAIVLARAARGRPWPRLLKTAGLAPAAWAATAALALATLLCLTTIESLSLPVIAVGAAGAAAALALLARRGTPRLAGRPGAAVDVAIALLLLAAVPDLLIFSPEEPAHSFETAVIQFHQNFLLGPANEVLAGSAVLVDTSSQYGVAPIYLLAAWLEVLPAGYGAFGLLDGILTALFYVAAYALLRIAGASRPLAGLAMGVAVVALVFNLTFSVGALPQQGPLRFGLPLLLVLAASAGARWPRYARASRVGVLCVVGLSSIWALEALAYTLATFVAVVCMEAWTREAAGRLRWLVRQGVTAVAACVAAHLAFAGLTLAAAGELPDWGQYLAFLDSFLFGRVGEVTYDFAPWSPALAVGGAYAASAAALILLVRRHDLLESERAAAIALAGTTAYGIALFSYFVDRSAEGILPYVALPSLLAITLWLSLLLRAETPVPASVRRRALAVGLSLALLVTSVSWSSVAERFPRSALAHAFPRGNSFRDAIERLADPPPLDPRATEGERLLERYLPGEGRVAILTLPDLGTEILIRSERGSELGFSNPVQESYIRSERLPVLADAAAELRAGDRLLVDRGALEALARLRADPGSLLRGEFSYPGLLAPLQEAILQRIGRRFDLRPISPGRQELVIVELVPRR